MSSPRQPTEAAYARMDRADREDMHWHNAFGERHCGWVPPR
jgi:hypothetical protein